MDRVRVRVVERVPWSPAHHPAASAARACRNRSSRRSRCRRRHSVPPRLESCSGRLARSRPRRSCRLHRCPSLGFRSPFGRWPRRSPMTAWVPDRPLIRCSPRRGVWQREESCILHIRWRPVRRARRSHGANFAVWGFRDMPSPADTARVKK